MMQLGNRLENVTVDKDAWPIDVCVERAWEKRCKRPGTYRPMRLGGHLICPGCDQTCRMDHLLEGVADPDRLQVKIWNAER